MVGLDRRRNLQELRPLVAAVATILAICFIALLSVTLPHDLAALLLDRWQTFPFSVQSGMWIAFFVGLGELTVRALSTRLEQRQLAMGYLPQDE